MNEKSRTEKHVTSFAVIKLSYANTEKTQEKKRGSTSNTGSNFGFSPI